jgi:ABC-type uncharacterized transport system substrate-binding protein
MLSHRRCCAADPRKGSEFDIVDHKRQSPDLSEKGYVDGRNLTIEFRWAGGRYENLPAMAAELVHQKVAVLVSTGGEPTVRAAMAATSSIPIVFTIGQDPVDLGLVASLTGPAAETVATYEYPP